MEHTTHNFKTLLKGLKLCSRHFSWQPIGLMSKKDLNSSRKSDGSFKDNLIIIYEIGCNFLINIFRHPLLHTQKYSKNKFTTCPEASNSL